MKKTLSSSFLLVLVLLVALVATPVFGAGDQGRDRADQARQRHTDELMAIDGVVGVALGLNQGGKGAVVVLTREAGVQGIPRELDGGVPVRVMVTGEIVALNKPPHDHPTGGDDEDPPPEPSPSGD